MRRLAAGVLLMLAPLHLGCGDSCGDVACGDPETLYVELPTGVPSGASVEVCFEDACGTADMANPTDGSVPWSEVGRWGEDKGEPVVVSVTQDGAELSRGSAVADKAGSCCGDHWTVRPG